MICPKDFAAMNETEHNGVSMGKCPVCGLIVVEDAEGRLSAGEGGLYPAAADCTELQLKDMPYGMPSAEPNEHQTGTGKDTHHPAPEQAYGMPPQPRLLSESPYGYVPEECGSGAASETAALAYGEAPAFGAKAPGEERDGSGPALRAHPYFIV